jgi:DUF971 family protein
MSVSEPVRPVSLERLADATLRISWSDGLIQQVRPRLLRDACPCATCQEKQAGRTALPPGRLPVLSAAETMPLGIERMEPAGNYGYRIRFSDGHASGIFTFELLRAIGDG